MSEKKNLERQANEAYDSGRPLLLDAEFDLLADNGLDLSTRSFRKKVDHPILMGSLSKKKTAAAVAKFLGEGVHWVEYGPKLDGASLRLSYVDGQLAGGSSRGNGHIGECWTDNLMLTNVVKTLKKPVSVEVRAEAIMSQRHTDKFDTNLRGIVPGMLRAGDARPELALIDVFAFEIFGEGLVSQADKRRALQELFPSSHLVETQLLFSHDAATEEAPRKFFADPFGELMSSFDFWKERLDYAIDGVVLHKGSSGIDTPLPVQDSLKPTDKTAVKFGDEGFPAEVGRIPFQLGLYGVLTPVLVLAEPVEIDSTMVTRASASNYSLLKAAGLGVGAQIEICKNGEIIPGVKEVIVPSQVGLELPLCPECGVQSVLSDSGVHALCVNEDCRGNELVKLQRFFDIFAIDAISDATIETLFSAGHTTLESIFGLTVADLVKLEGFADKSANYLVSSLKSVSLSEAKIIKAVALRGLGERKGAKLLKHFVSIDNLVESVSAKGMVKVEGFGPIQSKMIEDNIQLFAQTKARFESLGIKIETVVQKQEVPATQKIIMICATGTAPMPRKEFEAHVQGFGYALQDRINSDTQYLICADLSGSSSKLKKARSLGIKILDYSEFLSLLETPAVEPVHAPEEPVTTPEKIKTVPDAEPEPICNNEKQDSLFALW